MFKKVSLWLLIIALVTLMVGCGSTQTSDNATSGNEVSVYYNKDIKGRDTEQVINPEMDSNSAQYAVADNAATAVAVNGGTKPSTAKEQGLVNNTNADQKIIFTGQVNIQTLDFEKTKTNLWEYIISIGGFTQNSSVQGVGISNEGMKSAQYTFRIPKTKYNQAFIDIRKFGTVVLEQSNGEDISAQYIDTEARLKSLKIQQERLQILLQKADKMEDILKIEKELQTTLYEIENYTGTLKKWDSLIEYSTLTVNISEVEQIKPVTPKDKDGLLSRIAFGFKDSVLGVWNFLQDSIVFLVAALPIIIPLGVIGYLAYRVARRKIKRSKKVKAED